MQKHQKVLLHQFLMLLGLIVAIYCNLIQQCKLPKNLKNYKLFSPSFKYFTGNSNFKDNKKFLNFKIEKIFSYSENKNDNSLQMKNMKFIDALKKYMGEKEDKNFDMLKKFLNMTFKDAIINYYESPEFNEFCSYQKAISLNEECIKSKSFSLLEKNGFFKLFD